MQHLNERGQGAVIQAIKRSGHLPLLWEVIYR